MEINGSEGSQLFEGKIRWSLHQLTWIEAYLTTSDRLDIYTVHL